MKAYRLVVFVYESLEICVSKLRMCIYANMTYRVERVGEVDKYFIRTDVENMFNFQIDHKRRNAYDR